MWPFIDDRIHFGITGLRQSGKTVFISSILNQLLYEKNLSNFFPKGNREFSAQSRSLPHHLPEFPLHQNIESIKGKENLKILPKFPKSTDCITYYDVDLKFVSNNFFKNFGMNRKTTLKLRFVDYPGEWLLDLNLRQSNHKNWSKSLLNTYDSYHANNPNYKKFYDYCLDIIEGRFHFDNNPQEECNQLSHLYRTFLEDAKKLGYYFLQPGRFVMPGDAKFEQANMKFCPFPFHLMKQTACPTQDRIFSELSQRYQSYVNVYVVPFFEDTFQSFYRQLTLVDLISPLASGDFHLYQDFIQSLRTTLAEFSFDRPWWKPSFFDSSNYVQKIMFVASKIDYIPSNQQKFVKQYLLEILKSCLDLDKLEDHQWDLSVIASILCVHPSTITKDNKDIILLKALEEYQNSYRQYQWSFQGNFPTQILNPMDFNKLSQDMKVLPKRLLPLMNLNPNAQWRNPLTQNLNLGEVMRFLLYDLLL
ncbi:MAG: YcjX family protein [Candidatus Cloacimonetes bacterium]|nr:YcjX family protein [Candidatus Cloacimonadota bacterium]